MLGATLLVERCIHFLQIAGMIGAEIVPSGYESYRLASPVSRPIGRIRDVADSDGESRNGSSSSATDSAAAPSTAAAAPQSHKTKDASATAAASAAADAAAAASSKAVVSANAPARRVDLARGLPSSYVAPTGTTPDFDWWQELKRTIAASPLFRKWPIQTMDIEAVGQNRKTKPYDTDIEAL